MKSSSFRFSWLAKWSKTLTCSAKALAWLLCRRIPSYRNFACSFHLIKNSYTLKLIYSHRASVAISRMSLHKGHNKQITEMLRLQEKGCDVMLSFQYVFVMIAHMNWFHTPDVLSRKSIRHSMDKWCDLHHVRDPVTNTLSHGKFIPSSTPL